MRMTIWPRSKRMATTPPRRCRFATAVHADHRRKTGMIEWTGMVEWNGRTMEWNDPTGTGACCGEASRLRCSTTVAQGHDRANKRALKSLADMIKNRGFLPEPARQARNDCSGCSHVVGPQPVAPVWPAEEDGGSNCLLPSSSNVSESRASPATIRAAVEGEVEAETPWWSGISRRSSSANIRRC